MISKENIISLSVCCNIVCNILLSFWLGSENVPNVKYMYIISSLVIIFSVIQRLYLSVNYYTKGLNKTTLLQFIELGFKIVFILFTFDYFQELAPIIGWFFIYNLFL